MQDQTRKSEVDTHLLAYLAGVIDSDGYITIARKNGPKRLDEKIPRYYNLKVGCNQVDQAIPSLLKETFGGNLYTFQTKRLGLPWFMWYCWSQQAAHCCSLLLPYLRLKRKQAELSIEFNKLIKVQYEKRQGAYNISEEMELERDQLYWSIRQLNHTRNPRYNQIAGRFSDKGVAPRTQEKL